MPDSINQDPSIIIWEINKNVELQPQNVKESEKPLLDPPPDPDAHQHSMDP